MTCTNWTNRSTAALFLVLSSLLISEPTHAVDSPRWRSADRTLVAVTDPAVQQAIESLVKRGAVIQTRTDASGTHVTEVKLLGKQFTNEVIDQLRFFHDLETIRCIDARVDDEFVMRLDQFPRLRVLGFFNASITDRGLAFISKSAVGNELRQLLLGRTMITDLGLQSVAKLPRLYLLELSGTRVTDAGLIEVAKLEQLKVFRFRGTTVSDKGIAYLKRLRKLMLVSTGGSRVTQSGIAELRKQIPGVIVTDEEITISVEER